MHIPLKVRPIVAAAALLLAGCQHVVAPKASANTCASDQTAIKNVSDTVRAFFEALARDDDAAVRALTTPDFYAFEIGKRYSGPELSKVIADAHASGRILQWNVGPIDARIDCGIAFAAWENSGAAGTAGKLQPRAWLESALLVKQDGRWAIAVLHSTPKDPRP